MQLKLILIILIGLNIFGLVSSIVVYSGESYSFPSKEFEYYSIVGNLSSMEGTQVSWENGNTTIKFNKYTNSENLTFIFFDREKETITVYSGGGRGGSSTKYVDRNVTVEVPTYVDKEVEIEVEKEVEIEKEVYKNSWWSWVILIVSIIIISALTRNALKKRKENIYTDERGLENGKEEENI
jgi:hypothetical protein